MNAKTFTEQLWLLAPNADKLKLDGLDQDDVDEIRETFRCELKPGTNKHPERPLLDLVSSFDVSEVEIGMVCFSNEIEDRDDATIVGEVESDPLLINKATGEVIVEEFGSRKHILWRCARTEHQFLDALIVVADWSARAMETPEGETLKSPNKCDVIAEATNLAGGENFRDFYLMLVGADEDE